MLQQQQQQHEQVVPTFDLHPQAMKQAQKELSHAKTSITLLKNDQDVRERKTIHQKRRKLMIPTYIRPTSDLHPTCAGTPRETDSQKNTNNSVTGRLVG